MKWWLLWDALVVEDTTMRDDAGGFIDDVCGGHRETHLGLREKREIKAQEKKEGEFF